MPLQPSDYLSPSALIRAGKAAHPAFKFATAVGGLAGIVAIVLRFGLSPASLVFGIIIVVVLMVLFFVFAQATRLRNSTMSLPSLILVWAFLALAIATAILLFTSAFFDSPLPIRNYLIRSLDPATDGAAADSSPSLGEAVNVKAISIDPQTVYVAVASYLEDRSRKYNHETKEYESHKPSAQEVISYIDYIASEAEFLAAAWDEVSREFISGALQEDSKMREALRVKYRISPNANEPHFSRLRQFYSLMPQTAGRFLAPDWLSRISYSVETILLERSKTKEMVERAVASAEDAKFFSNNNTIDDLKTLRDSVNVMQREAAALRAIATVLRVQNSENTAPQSQ